MPAYRLGKDQSASMLDILVSECTAHSRSAAGQTRSFGDVGSMSGLPESGHGGATYEYTPLG
jgi:hypothetical protein